MAYTKELQTRLQETLAGLQDAGLNKEERYIKSAQGVEIEVEFPLGSAPRRVLNFCANNYLGLASHPRVVAAAHRGLDERGYGMSSVRFICGTQDSHHELEQRLADFLGFEEAILFASCFDANAAFFEVFFAKEDVIISDRLIHASLIDGIRLCEAQRDTYKNSDTEHLEKKLQMWQDKARTMCVVTDGVFSMDGMIAPLARIAELCEQYGALLVVDDSHATGFIGKTGRGTHEHHNVMDKVDVITTTLGKALGGASGGLVAGPPEIVNMLRNRGRPYLFSNAVPPTVIYGAIEVMNMLSGSTELRDTLEANAARFRSAMQAAGFTLVPGDSPIVPVMFGDARLAADMSRAMLDEGIYVVGFSHPVVPMGKARIRVQLSASHTNEQIDQCVAAFIKCGKQHGVIE
jgi:glycine C-acetyltransferase